MPSYQQADFLRQAIESVLTQEGPKVDLSVRDGGSTDGSVAILGGFGSRLRWCSEIDGGQVHALNAGLRESSAEICGFLNSDDQLEPQALRRVAEIFAENPAIDVVYGRGWFIDEGGRRTRGYPTVSFDFETLVQHCFICQPAAFWRRRVHDRFGWFDPACDNTFDYEFWLRLAVGGARFMHVPEFFASSREHPTTKSQRNRSRIFSEIRRMQMKTLGYIGRNWWEQQLRYWRDESSSRWRHVLPGRRGERLYDLAWLPYVLWRRKRGGPLFYRRGHWRA